MFTSDDGCVRWAHLRGLCRCVVFEGAAGEVRLACVRRGGVSVCSATTMPKRAEGLSSGYSRCVDFAVDFSFPFGAERYDRRCTCWLERHTLLTS